MAFEPQHAEPTPMRRPRADQARLVADVLRHQIHAGGYPEGLPGEADLANEFFVSRNTVREALAALKDEGLIDRGPRTGTHVAIRKYDHGLDALVGLKETFKGYGEIRNEVRATMTVSAPPSVANKLELKPGEPIVFIERLRYLGDLPLSLDMTYLAADIGQQVIEHSLETNDVFALIEQVTGQRLGNAGAGRGGRAGRPAFRGHPAGARRRLATALGTAHPPRRRTPRRPRIHPHAWRSNHPARQPS